MTPVSRYFPNWASLASLARMQGSLNRNITAKEKPHKAVWGFSFGGPSSKLLELH
jgi:hypothetical protein